MLPLKNRLKLPTFWKNRPDHQIYSDHFKVLLKKVSENTDPQIGFIISAKVGKATTRNRIRRTLIRYLRDHLEKIDSQLQIIWLVSPKAAAASDEEINSSIGKILSKILILQPPK